MRLNEAVSVSGLPALCRCLGTGPGRLLSFVWLAALLLPAPAAAQPVDLDGDDLAAMTWRSIGPYRGGRVVAVAGIPGDPHTYYMGSTGGGVWKTTDAGESWANVSDGFFGTASVGAVAVAESDRNVVYVGMGEHPVRGVTTSHGDGVYRSTDAGRTWTRLGLENTRAVSRIRVHPDDPDLVYVAAQGAPYGPSEARGVYRSGDGGESWEKVLFVSEDAGASDLAMDMTNPRILYAAFWDHRRTPWHVRSGGPGSGIWKSTDGGESWTELTEGLPGLMGKIGLDVSRADPDRLWANIEAADGKGGVYRSDDAGASWTQVNDERVTQARSWYYMEAFAHPTDPNTVYVLNAPLLRSVDGGRTFESIPVGHGDTHDLWIDPLAPERMILGDDGGAEITADAGGSWSTLRNQPTAQFYRVSVDRRFPYHVYGGQQDNSAIGIASAASGGIGWNDFYSVAGCESAYLAFDPDDPRYVYGGCYQGLIDRWDRKTGRSKPVQAYPYLGLGTDPVDQRYRFNWNAPIVASPHDPDVIYHAGNVLLRTTDRARSWEEISPDLTRDQEDRQGAGGGPITNEAAGGEIYNTISAVEPSPLASGMIWAGTDDGLVHLTRDGGATWTEVTPQGVGEALINAIDASPHEPGTAYLAVSKYKFDDFMPHIYRTTDYGASWSRVVEGIPENHWVRVVREDPVRPGLLYAGTELGMYVSFDGGDLWQTLQLDLPVVPVTDLTFAGERGRDLVAATQGRGFWILDDLAPLRDLTAEVAAAPVHLHEPTPAYRVRWGSGGTRTGTNPPSGALIHYRFAEEPHGPVTLEIVDVGGEVVRTFVGDPDARVSENADSLMGEAETQAGDADREAEGADDDEGFDPLPLEAGLNRVVWDFRGEALPEVDGLTPYGSLEGRTHPPGRYTVRLTLGEEVRERTLELRPDPRWDEPPEAYAEQDALLAEAHGIARELYEGVLRMRDVRDQVKVVVERARRSEGADTVVAAGSALRERLQAWEEPLVQPAQETFQDVINFPNKLDAQILHLLGSVDGTQPPLTQGAEERLADLRGRWSRHRSAMGTLLAEDVASFNALVRAHDVEAVVIPEPRVRPE